MVPDTYLHYLGLMPGEEQTLSCQCMLKRLHQDLYRFSLGPLCWDHSRTHVAARDFSSKPFLDSTALRCETSEPGHLEKIMDACRVFDFKNWSSNVGYMHCLNLLDRQNSLP